MSTATPNPSVGPPGLPAASSRKDWLANCILAAKTITATAEALPFPYVKAALGPVIPILEAVQVRGVSAAQKVFKFLIHHPSL
jgi:hypothetical protein